MAFFPTAVITTATLINPSAGNPTNNPSHSGAHTLLNGEVIAIETALGTGITNVYASVNAAITTLGTLVAAAQTTATAAQTTASAARLLSSVVGTYIAGSVSAGTTYIVSPFAGTVSAYHVRGAASPAVPGTATVTVGSAGAILLTVTITSAGSSGTVQAMANTSGTTTIAAGGSMLITLGNSGTAYQQTVCVYVSRTA